ncbi:hypothetical protein K523DRAFT_405289 [Schizophyllum commune Tattone D]|nr:hypothetical protein K523DRAFT_405289 [Schizophyllum commune Tattone D]
MGEPVLSPQAPPLDRPVHRKWAASFAAGTVGPIAPYGSSSDLDSVCPCQTRYKEAHFPVPSRRRLARLPRRLSASPNTLSRWALLCVSLSPAPSFQICFIKHIRLRPPAPKALVQGVKTERYPPTLARPATEGVICASLYVAFRLLQGFLSA